MAFSDPLFPKRFYNNNDNSFPSYRISKFSEEITSHRDMESMCKDIPFYFIFFIHSPAVSTSSQIFCQLLGLNHFSSKQLLWNKYLWCMYLWQILHSICGFEPNTCFIYIYSHLKTSFLKTNKNTVLNNFKSKSFLSTKRILTFFRRNFKLRFNQG